MSKSHIHRGSVIVHHDNHKLPGTGTASDDLVGSWTGNRDNIQPKQNLKS